MSTIRNPVGPLPPQVYWRRRLVVGIALLAIIVVIVLIIVGPGSGQPGAQPTPEPQTSETADPGDDTEVAACLPGQVEVTPVTDSNNYPAGATPLLSFTLLNTGAAPCTMPAGSDVQEYLIVSGSDRIWASTDCQGDPEPFTATLEPGVEVASTPVPWSRTRSTPGDCATVDSRPSVTAGGATYRLSVTVGGVASEGDRPFLLN